MMHGTNRDHCPVRMHFFSLHARSCSFPPSCYRLSRALPAPHLPAGAPQPYWPTAVTAMRWHPPSPVLRTNPLSGLPLPIPVIDRSRRMLAHSSHASTALRVEPASQKSPSASLFRACLIPNPPKRGAMFNFPKVINSMFQEFGTFWRSGSPRGKGAFER